MSEKTTVVTDLTGKVRYFPKSPYAFGDAIQSLDARIRIDEPAETIQQDGRRILYQRYHLFNADQIPHSRDQTDDKELIRHYVRELQKLFDKYPNRLDQLTVLDVDASSVVIHGETSQEYGGRDKTRVQRLSSQERWQIKQHLETH